MNHSYMKREESTSTKDLMILGWVQELIRVGNHDYISEY